MSRKKNSLTRQVRRAYRQRELADICLLPEAGFGRVFGMETTEVPQRGWKAPPDAPNDFYHFRDNGSRVLSVAHLDTVVQPDRRTPYFANTQDGPYIRSGALDDRLGAYVILQLLPKLGVSCDQLLTVGEESCSSTASFFESPGKDYDWVIEFDRGGTDVVMYDYEDAASRQAVRDSGAPVGKGSFTDICVLEQLGVKAFNWGVGYGGNYHSENGYAFLNDTFMMVAKYLRFHAQNAGTAMPHVPAPRYSYSDRYYSSTSDRDCQLCGALGAVDTVTGYCEVCDACQDCYEDRPDCQCWLPRYLAQKDIREDNRDGLNRREGGQWLPWYMRPENREDQGGAVPDGAWTATTIAVKPAEPDNGASYLRKAKLRALSAGTDEADDEREPTQAELDEIQAEMDKEGEEAAEQAAS